MNQRPSCHRKHGDAGEHIAFQRPAWRSAAKSEIRLVAGALLRSRFARSLELGVHVWQLDPSEVPEIAQGILHLKSFGEIGVCEQSTQGRP